MLWETDIVSVHLPPPHNKYCCWDETQVHNSHHNWSTNIFDICGIGQNEYPQTRRRRTGLHHRCGRGWWVMLSRMLSRMLFVEHEEKLCWSRGKEKHLTVALVNGNCSSNSFPDRFKLEHLRSLSYRGIYPFHRYHISHLSLPLYQGTVSQKQKQEQHL